MDEINQLTIIQKIGEDLMVIIPKDICEKLNVKKGSTVIIETFICSGEAGIRIKPKS